MVLKQERRVNAASVAKRQSLSTAAAQKKLEVEEAAREAQLQKAWSVGADERTRRRQEDDQQRETRRAEKQQAKDEALLRAQKKHEADTTRFERFAGWSWVPTVLLVRAGIVIHNYHRYERSLAEMRAEVASAYAQLKQDKADQVHQCRIHLRLIATQCFCGVPGT